MSNTERPLPMLAKPYDPVKHDPLLLAGRLVAEEKYDGHRCVVRTMPRVGDNALVSAWSRTGIDCTHKLPSHLQDALKQLPYGVYDCELIVPGMKSTDVVRLELATRRQLVVFDLLELSDSGGATVSLMPSPWSTRREMLASMDALRGNYELPMFLSTVCQVKSPQELDALVEDIWARSGEGVIVKNKTARYEPGKRRDAFMKIKECGTTVITVIRFEAGTTTDSNVVIGHDEDGTTVRVKVVDDEWRAKVAANPEAYYGRQLRIEYHQMTSDGAYRHARWDRWEDE